MTKRLVSSLVWHQAVADPVAWAFRMEYAGADEVCLRVAGGMPLASCHALIEQLVRTLTIPLVVQPFSTGDYFLNALLDLGIDRLLLPLDALASVAELSRRHGATRVSVLAGAESYRRTTSGLWAARDAGACELVLEDAADLPVSLDPWGLPVAVLMGASAVDRGLDWLMAGADALYLEQIADNDPQALPQIKEGVEAAGLVVRR